MQNRATTPHIWKIVRLFYTAEAIFNRQHDRYEELVAQYVQILGKPREEIPGTADDRGSAAPPCLSAFAASVPAARSKVRGPLDAEPQKARPWREARGRCRGGPCDARSIHADIKVYY